MAATVTESIVYGLEQGTNKGGGVYVGRLQIDDGETLQVPFKRTRAMFVQAIDDVDTNFCICSAGAHGANAEAGAVVTFSVGKISAYAAQAGVSYYVMIIGDNTSSTDT